jgi:hypothetical protein
MEWLSVVWAVIALATVSIIFSKLFRRSATGNNTANADTLRARSRLLSSRSDDVTDSEGGRFLSAMHVLIPVFVTRC